MSAIKTRSSGSAAKKAVWHTNVLFTETAILPFSMPCISITTRPISIKFLCILYPLYMQPHIRKLKEIGQVVCEICVLENCPIFFTFSFFFFAPFNKSNFEPNKTPFSLIDFFQIWHTYKTLCGLFSLNLKRFKQNLSEL